MNSRPTRLAGGPSNSSRGSRERSRARSIWRGESSRNSSGEALVVALTALGAPKEKLVRILASNDLLFGDNYERINALARLKDALHPIAARQIIRAMSDAEARPASRVRYVPASDLAVTQTRARVAQPAAKPAPSVSAPTIRDGQQAS